MSDVADEELLNGEEEFDYEGYDIDYEEEEALLEDKEYGSGSGDEERFKSSKQVRSEKKEQVSEPEDPEEDVLNLGIEVEEDFQDIDDKITYEEDKSSREKKKEGKFTVERTPVSSNVSITTKAPLKTQVSKRPLLTNIKTTDTVKTRLQSSRKIQPTIRQQDNKRKRGIGRGNFQSRIDSIRNNIQKDHRPGRRSSTVFINPKYEGVVQINENNARLAWDNSNFPQNNTQFIQPWASGNAMGNDLNPQGPNTSLLLNNLVEIAASFSQPPNLLQVNPAPQTSFLNFEPPPNIYQNQIAFQPGVGMQNPPPPYHNQNQVQNHQPPFQPYQLTGSQQFNNQPAATSYDYYNNTSNAQQNYQPEAKNHLIQPNFDNRNMNYYDRVINNQTKPGFVNQQIDNDALNKNTFRSNFYKKDFRSGNFGYNVKDGFQNRNSAYNQGAKVNQNTNYNFTSYENRNMNNKQQECFNKNVIPTTYKNRNLNQRENIYSENSRGGSTDNINYNRNAKVNPNFKSVQNRPLRQIITQDDQTRQSNFNSETNARNTPNKNFDGQKCKRLPSNNSADLKIESPEKKLKKDDKLNTTKDNENNEKSVEQNKEQTAAKSKLTSNEEEDEEMRLYRLKIEEQKREREKVLKRKEERRRMMLQQQQQQQQMKVVEKPLSTAPEKANNNQQRPTATNSQKVTSQQYAAGTANKQKTNYQYHPATVTSNNNQQRPSNQIPVLSTQNRSQQTNSTNLRSNTEDDLSNLTFKISNNLQRNVPAPEKPLQRDSSSTFMSDRVVLVKNKSDSNEKGGMLSNLNVDKTLRNDNESADVGQGLSSFFNNRKVLKKDNTLINTRLVLVNNLSASTTQNKLVAMTRGIGEIQKLRMDKQERQATILFKTVASAHAFFKKYQRYMLDLSMIEVKLEPMI